MALTHFCPSCWSEIGAEPVCLVCGTDVRDLSGDSYEEKLLWALYHPEPTVPVRAATILGELGSRAAVEPLIELAASGSDLYIQEAAVTALGRICDARALPVLNRLRREGAVRVRIAADRALNTLAHETSPSQP
ncbi:MAG TPA: HEAT repeat domain-containing protein [Terriglobia bacterium]|nr:HEAT repeat domain-containing protein [Terriglobia bacterium]